MVAIVYSHRFGLQIALLRSLNGPEMVLGMAQLVEVTVLNFHYSLSHVLGLQLEIQQGYAIVSVSKVEHQAQWPIGRCGGEKVLIERVGYCCELRILSLMGLQTRSFSHE